MTYQLPVPFYSERCPHCGAQDWREGRVQVVFDDPYFKGGTMEYAKVLMCNECKFLYDNTLRFYKDED